MQLYTLRRIHRYLLQAGWNNEAARRALRAYVVERLGGKSLCADAKRERRAFPAKVQQWLDGLGVEPEGKEDGLSPQTLSVLNEFFSSERKQKGIFYTPWPIARQLAQEALLALLTRQAGLSSALAQSLLQSAPPSLTPQEKQQAERCLQALRVCDPAAGAGGLLVPFALELAALRRRLTPALSEGEALDFVLKHNLYAGDISAQALEDLQLRFALLLRQYGARETDSTPLAHCFTGDALRAEKGQSVWVLQFPEIFRRQGFDVILSNPPYVGQKNHRALFEPLRQNPLWRSYAEPKSDLCYFFFHLALTLLRPGGIGAFLTPPYFATAAGAKTLRKRLQADAALLYMQDFGEERLFSAAAGGHSLITVFEKNNAPAKPLCRIGEQFYSQQELFGGPDLFLQTRPAAQPFLQSALTKMAAAPRTLGQIAHISNGLMTGCDKISAAHLRQFNLPGVQKGDGVFVLSAKEKDALGLSAAEKAKLKPFFKNSDISSYTAAKQPQNWLVDFFYPNDRDLDFSQYPRLRAHLARFRPVLLARKQNNNGIDKLLAKGVYWFGSVRRKMDFEADKIAAPQRAAANKFAFVPGPWYASSDVYFISRPQEGLSLWFLLALLNSAPYFAWLSCNGKRKGCLLELYSAPLKALPVPAATAAQQKQLEMLAQQIYRAKSADPQADVSALQAQTELLVNTLFGFSAQEAQSIQGLHPTCYP